MFDVVIQGPVVNSIKFNEFIKSILDSGFVNRVIISTVDGSCEDFLPQEVFFSIYDDPGENIGGYSHPLNIKRYYFGVSQALKLTVSKKTLIVRSDMIFNIDLFVKAVRKVKHDQVVFLDVTSKCQFIKKNWLDHYCDWLYYADSNFLKRVFGYYDYESAASTFGDNDGRFLLSPEKYLFTKMKKDFNDNGKLIYQDMKVISSESIKVNSLKKDYVKIPFGINKKYIITDLEICLSLYGSKYRNNPLLKLFFKVYCFARFFKYK